MDIKRIIRQSVIAAIYVVLTTFIAPFSFLSLQFRIAESLALLAFFDEDYIYGIGLGCFLANLQSPIMLDAIIGTLSSIAVAVVMSKMKNFYLSSLITLVGMIPIALEIYFLFPSEVGFFVLLGQLIISEFIVVCIIGVPLFIFLRKNEFVKNILNLHKELS